MRFLCLWLLVCLWFFNSSLFLFNRCLFVVFVVAFARFFNLNNAFVISCLLTTNNLLIEKPLMWLFEPFIGYLICYVNHELVI